MDSDGGFLDASTGAYHLDLGDCYTGNICRKDVWLSNCSKETLLVTVASASPDELLFDSEGRSGNYDRILSIVSSNSHGNNGGGGRKTPSAGSSAAKDSELLPSTNSSSHTSSSSSSSSSSSNSSTTVMAQQLRSRGTLLGYAPFKASVISDSWTGHKAKHSSRIVDAFTISSLTLRDDFDDNTGFSETFRQGEPTRRDWALSTVQREWELADRLGHCSSSPGGSSSGQDSPRARYNPFDNENAHNNPQRVDFSKTRLSSVHVLEPLAITPGERKHLALLFCPAAAAGGADGSLSSRSVRVTLSWTGLDLSGQVRRPAANCSRVLVCLARACASVISVSPRAVDLGECNVGEYRRATFFVTNESDLPARVVPTVESETLGIMEQVGMDGDTNLYCDLPFRLFTM